MFDILLNHNTLVLFGIIFFGIALGSIKIYGLNLGLSGVLFVALAAGHYRLAIPNGVGQLGLALFVYCVGLSAGNRFFSAIAKQGSKLAVMSAVIVAFQPSSPASSASGSMFPRGFPPASRRRVHQHPGPGGSHGKPAGSLRKRRQHRLRHCLPVRRGGRGPLRPASPAPAAL